ncbi:hypothetical protein JMJ56_22645 [Belnapia sp. T18]|uniref:Uncharacterized protein n=1 Tax=Belnapia arida TaxID=2804533 RepID=A0ABS1U843_9PROT|nr:hypothetical protein [Belnapia arida]MBL6080818.1 hypothetical protein [Belnapia arida]
MAPPGNRHIRFATGAEHVCHTAARTVEAEAMAEKPETEDERPEQQGRDADGEMLGVGHSLSEAYLRRLVEDGDRTIERSDFVVASTREEMRRILRECWTGEALQAAASPLVPSGGNRDPGLANYL